MNFAQFTEIESLCFHLDGRASRIQGHLNFPFFCRRRRRPQTCPPRRSLPWSPSPWSLSVLLGAVQGDVHRLLAIVGWDVGLVHRVVGVHLASSCHEDMETGSYSWQHRGQLPEAPHGLAWARSNWHEVPIEPVGLSATPVQRCPLNTALPRCGGLMTSTLLKRTILWSSKSCKASLRIHKAQTILCSYMNGIYEV